MGDSWYLSKKEVLEMGFCSMGKNVMISRDARIMSPKTISLGNNVLIDAFTIMNGDIRIGNHVHISSHCEIYGGKHSYIEIGDYSSLSSHTSLYSQTDDYLGNCLNNPTVSTKYRNVIEKPIILERCVLIGTHSVVLPGVCLAEGCSFGANSLVNKSTQPGGLYAGVPCRRMRDRSLDEIRALMDEVDSQE